MIYFIVEGDGGPTKIGFSRDPRKRLKVLQTASSKKLTLCAVLPGERDLEHLFHVRLEQHRIHGEWFEFDAVLWLLRQIAYECECVADQITHVMMTDEEFEEIDDELELQIGWSRECALNGASMLNA